MTESSWKPGCSLELLQKRAQMLALIRQFFADREVLEVETPLLCQAGGTDPQLDFFTTEFRFSSTPQKLFLQTSPEFAMKRLLAAGSGSIYQICKAFRNGEAGRFHNPEFSILEWYRVGFDLHQLMDEVAELIALVLKPQLPFLKAVKISYGELFLQKTGLNALEYSSEAYRQYALSESLPEAASVCENHHDLWLDFIFSHKIQPQLADNQIFLIHSYPVSQASLARINAENPFIADRFEVFVNGVELGNGFFELTDASEQRSRFEKEILFRQQKRLREVSADECFLAALEAGLPDCSGIAIGLDRLLMLLANENDIDRVLAFSVAKT